MTETLLTKYRPINFSEVIGNEIAVKALRDAIRSSSRNHTYLFTGGSGVGKTTLARIIATEVDAFVEEINAATRSGVDDTRSIVENTQFAPVMGKPTKMLIIDECHNLSKKGWEPLLNLTEHPPDYLYIALCTTEPDTVPKTIKTRAYPVSLKPLRVQELQGLITDICAIEGWTVVPEVFDAITLAAEGSARMALNILQAGHACSSKQELSTIIDAVTSDNQPIIQICNYLMKSGENWKPISKLLGEIDDFDAAITIATRYLAGCMARSEGEQARHLWSMLACFAVAPLWDKKVQCYAAVGKILWGGVPF